MGQLGNKTGMKTNAVQPTTSQGHQRSYVFSTPTWGPLPSRDRQDQVRVKEIEGP